MRIEDLGLVATVLLRCLCTTDADGQPALDIALQELSVYKGTK